LNLGPGYFRDFDSDYSYGIPVCGGCGGIGTEILGDESFRLSAKIVMDSRFRYCPTDSANLSLKEPRNPQEALNNLRDLITEVVRHYAAYRFHAKPNCFAEKIQEGGLGQVLRQLEERIQTETN
jgi:hypothetical protein